MPGIYGKVDFSGNRIDMQSDIGTAMKHESWYVHDRWFSDRVLLGRVHHGVLSTEKQPASNHDETLQLVLHGYIVDLDNHISWLERQNCFNNQWSPSLVALYLYQHLGESFVEKLNGSFTIAIWDGIYDRLLLFTDRFGSRPVYFTRCSQKFFFASEIKCLLQDKEVSRSVNLRSVASLLTFGTVIGNHTLFDSIEKFPSGSVLKFDGRAVSIRKYWDFSYKEGTAKGAVQDYANELGRLLQQAVKRCLQVNSRVGLALSGGLDSRYVGGYLAQELGPGFHTYSFGRRWCPDIVYASKVAKVLQSCHHTFLTKGEYVYENGNETIMLTEGMLDLLDTQKTILSKNVQRSDVNIIWTGFMVDLMWGGSFLTWGVLDWEKRACKFSEALHNRIPIFMPIDVQKQLFNPDVWEQVAGGTQEIVAGILADCKAKEDANRADYVFLRTRVQHFTVMANLISLTRKFEYQVPTIDNDLLDFSLNLPVDMRLNYRMYLKAVSDQFPNLAQIPRTGTGLPLIMSQGRRRRNHISNKICDSLRYRLKKYSQGKVEIPHRNRDWHDRQRWSRTSMRPYIDSILLSDRCLSRSFFRPEALRQLVSDHMSNKVRGTSWLNLSPLLTLELWQRMYIDV